MNDYVRSAKRAKRTRSAGRRRKRTQIARQSKRNFERQFNNNQLKRMLRRDAKQLSIQEKIYKLASYLETNKLLEEKKRLKEMKRQRRLQRKRANVSLEEKRRRRTMKRNQAAWDALSPQEQMFYLQQMMQR